MVGVCMFPTDTVLYVIRKAKVTKLFHHRTVRVGRLLNTYINKLR